jgi:hypothetical protein
MLRPASGFSKECRHGFGRTFFGTSAAAPHAAAIGALVAQGAPCLLDGSRGALEPSAARTALRKLVVDSAVPLSATGAPDNESGAGRADAAAAVQRTQPVFAGARSIVVDANSASGATLTPAQLGFSDPNRCSLTTLAWSGGCGTGPGDTVTCPRGTSNISVAASSNGLSFSAPVDMPACDEAHALIADNSARHGDLSDRRDGVVRPIGRAIAGARRDDSGTHRTTLHSCQPQ